MADSQDELRGIFPVTYIPPFLRNQFIVEEIVNVRCQLVGHYNIRAFDDLAFKYHDRTLDKEIMIQFHSGEIWKIEKTD